MGLGSALSASKRTHHCKATHEHPGCVVASLNVEDSVSDKVDALASNVDDALVSVDELENDPGTIEGKQIDKVKNALERAHDTVDEMEDAEDTENAP